MYKYLVEKTTVWFLDASVEVWLLWEGASDPSDDDVGGVVTCPDALLQRMLLDQRREESWVDRRAEVKLQPSITSKIIWGAVSINVSQVLMASGKSDSAVSSSAVPK